MCAHIFTILTANKFEKHIFRQFVFFSLNCWKCIVRKLFIFFRFALNFYTTFLLPNEKKKIEKKNYTTNSHIKFAGVRSWKLRLNEFLAFDIKQVLSTKLCSAECFQWIFNYREVVLCSFLQDKIIMHCKFNMWKKCASTVYAYILFWASSQHNFTSN